MRAACLLLVGCFMSGANAAEPNRPTTDADLQLLYTDKVEEAQNAIGFASYWREPLLRRAKDALDRQRFHDALGYYEAYLRLFPFGVLHWDEENQNEWAEVAFVYVHLRANRSPTEAEWLRQSVATIETFSELREACKRHDQPTCRRITDELVAKYPRSLFTRWAVLATCNAEFDGTLLFKYLKQLQTAGVSEQKCLLLIMFAASRMLPEDEFADDRRPRYTTADILRLSTNPLVRRAYLLADFQHEFRRPQSPPRFRQLGLQYEAEFPVDKKAEAIGTVVVYLANEMQREEAVWWVERGKSIGRPEQVADMLLTVAASYSRSDVDTAFQFYNAALFASPNHSTAARARLAIARIHRRRGDAELAAAILHEVVAFQSDDSTEKHDPADDSRNDARQMLARHYMEREEWELALKWWQAWIPGTGCGTGAEKMIADHKAEIVFCREKLEQQAADGTKPKSGAIIPEACIFLR